MQRVRAAADLVAGRGMYPLGMWVERVLDAMTTHDAEHPDHMDAIAWWRMRRTCSGSYHPPSLGS